MFERWGQKILNEKKISIERLFFVKFKFEILVKIISFDDAPLDVFTILPYDSVIDANELNPLSVGTKNRTLYIVRHEIE